MTENIKKATAKGFALLIGGVTFIGGVTSIPEYYENHHLVDISGPWTMINTVEKTKYVPYQGLEVPYRVFLIQDGKHISGHGEKWAENGIDVSAINRVPIQVEGVFDGTDVRLNFTEEGKKRKTTGQFDWHYDPEDELLVGSFSHTAASSSGSSMAARR